MKSWKNIPIGLCQCGCGQKTKIVERSEFGRGRVRGQPYRFIFGHKIPTARSVENQVIDGQTCCVVQLTREKTAIIDAEDQHLVQGGGWSARKSRNTWYASRLVLGQIIHMHDIICPHASELKIDHRDGDGLNNRRSNLRPATVSQNQRNRIHLNKNKTSKFRGVCRPRKSNRWKAEFTLNRKSVHIGMFSREIDAAKAYDRMAIKHYGEFARPNFPTETTSLRARL